MVLVTLGPRREALDRRYVDLTAGLPTHPHHHEGSWAVGRYLETPGARALSLDEAIALVKQVRIATARGASDCLESLATSVAAPIASIAIRQCPELPPTIRERIEDNRAQTYADSVMYRQALAAAAKARGWSVYWYDRDAVFSVAARTLGKGDITTHLSALGRAFGSPWQAKHKLAAAAALAAGRRSS